MGGLIGLHTSAWIKSKKLGILVDNFDIVGLVMNLPHEHAAGHAVHGVLAEMWRVLIKMP